MNKLLVFILASFLTTGCERTSNYVATIFEGPKPEEPVAKKENHILCPPDKPTLSVYEGKCAGEWDHSYDSNTQIYTCTYEYNKPKTCPSGSISIGQPSACEGQVDQHTKESVTSDSSCETLFKDNISASYRIVCCS